MSEDQKKSWGFNKEKAEQFSRGAKRPPEKPEKGKNEKSLWHKMLEKVNLQPIPDDERKK
jgi:hypothetical protein